MQVILLEKIQNLGSLGDQVNVKPGHGRNFLIPQAKAVPANEKNRKHIEARRAELEEVAKKELAAAQRVAEQLEKVALDMTAKAGAEGRLFGSIGTRDIVAALATKDITVAKSNILLPNGAIRQLGEHDVEIQLHSDLRVAVKINLTAAAETE